MRTAGKLLHQSAIKNFELKLSGFSEMVKLSKILFGLFSTGYSGAKYETISCNNDQNVSSCYISEM